MLVTERTREALKFRREERDLKKAGFRRHETDWEIHRGMRYSERILEARISCDGRYVYTRLGMPNKQVEGAEGCLQPQAPSRTPG
jgi:hypothetical protein